MQGIPSSADMAALMGSLQKSNLDLPRPSNAGYQTPLVPAGGTNSLSPLVPQQLAQTLSIATSSMNDLKLWPMLAKVQAQNTVVEYNRVLKHGGQHSPFISEGGNGILNRSTYEKVATKIRYMAERREVTDQASMVSIIGPSADAIAEETRRGTESLCFSVLSSTSSTLMSQRIATPSTASSSRSKTAVTSRIFEEKRQARSISLRSSATSTARLSMVWSLISW
jgi:hypothetical protein